MSKKRKRAASRDKPTEAATDKALTSDEIEALFDEAAREVEAERSLEKPSSDMLPAKLASELKPHLDALRRIFGNLNSQ